MKAQYSIGPDVVIAIAKIIGQCDFRTTVSLYTTSTNSPWVITIGENTWQRHLIVEKVEIGIDGLKASLAVLSTSESDKFGYDIRTDKIVRRIELDELVSAKYIGVKKVLFPPNREPSLN